MSIASTAPVATGDGAFGGQPPSATGHWLTAERVRVYSWMIVVIFAAVLVVWIGLSLPGLVDPRGKPFGYDFMAYWSTAQLALAGRAAAAFDWATISAVQHQAVAFLPDIWFPWHYPPTFLLVIAPLGLLPYPASLALFAASTAALWAALLRRVLPDRRAWIVAAAAPAGLITLLDGQNAFLTAAVAGFALLWLDRRPIAAGILIGLLAIKPHMAVLFPLALLAEGRWRSILAAAATVAGLCLASLAAFGWDSWAAFFAHLAVTQAMGEQGAVPWGTMPTAYIFALSLGVPAGAAAALQAMSALIAAGCVWRAWRNRAAPLAAKAAVLVTGSLLVSPYLFYYDLLWAALAIAWLAPLALAAGFRRGEREILLFAWLAPALMQVVHALTALQLGFLALLLLLAAAIGRAAPASEDERCRVRAAIDWLRVARWITRERLLRWGAGLAVMSLALLALHVVTHTAAGVSDGRGDELGNDFINFWSGVRLAGEGNAALAYDPGSFQLFEQSLTGPSSSWRIYVYPPVAMLLSLPLALFPFAAALLVWTAAGVGLCVALLRRLIGWRAAAVAILGVPASFLNILSGQNGHFTAAMLGGGLMLLERRPVLAGICFGGFAYKPQIALLLPFALAAAGFWRAFLAAGLTATVLVLASVVLLGGGAWAGFFDQLEMHRHLMETYVNFWHRMPTVFVAARVLGAAIPVAYAVQAVSAALAAVAVVALWRSPAALEVKAAGLVVAVFVATPHAFDYDGVVLIFAAAWLGREGRRTGFLAWERSAILALLAWPLVVMPATALAGLPLAPLVLWPALLVLLRRGLGDALFRRPAGLLATARLR